MTQFKLVQYERFVSSLSSEFFWQLQNVVEVMRGRSAHQLTFAEDKISTTLSLLQNGGIIGNAAGMMGSVGLSMLGNHIESKKNQTLTPEILSGSWNELKETVQMAAHQATERYKYYLSKCTESDAVELGRVGAQRIWEYIPRKRIAFTVENLLLGIYCGKSGRWQEDWRNNTLTGISPSDVAAKENNRQTAEGCLSHGGMAFYSTATTSFQYFVHPRDKKGTTQAKYGFMLIKSDEFKARLISKEKYIALEKAPADAEKLEALWQEEITVPGGVVAPVQGDLNKQFEALQADWCSFNDWQASAQAMFADLQATIAEHGAAISTLQSTVSDVSDKQGQLLQHVESVKSAQESHEMGFRQVASTVAELSGRKKSTYIPTPYTQPRLQLWAELEGFMAHVDDSHAPVVLVGAGGMGKSSIANLWLSKQKFTAKYDSIRNLPMSSTSIDASLQELAADLGVRTVRRERGEWLADVAREMKTQKWLMVWDNVDNATSVTDILPHFCSHTGYQQLIITTRDSAGWAASRAAVVGVDVFAPTEAGSYIQHQMKAANNPHFDKLKAADLADALGHHPLSLELAMGAVCVHQRTLAQYLQKLVGAGVAALSTTTSHKLSSQGRINTASTLKSLWGMSLESLTDSAVDLLQMLSFMSPSGVSRELCLALFEHAEDQDAFDEALLELRQRSLVQALEVQGGGEHWKVHRLLQEVVRGEALQSWTDTEASILRARQALRAVYIDHQAISTDETARNQRAREGLAHFSCLLEHLPLISPKLNAAVAQQWTVIALSCVASLELQLSLLQAAEKHFLSAYRMCKNDPLKDLAQYANICNSMGVLYQSLGDLDKARERLNESLQTLYTLHGRSAANDAIGAVLNSLGNTYMSSNDYEKAYEYLSQSMEIYGALAAKYQTKEYQMGLAIEIGSVGLCLLRRKKYDEAESNLKAALAIVERYYPNGHPEIAIFYAHFCTLYEAKGDAPAALRYAKLALEVDREVHGADVNHYSTAIALHNLAHTYAQQKEYAAAQTFFTKALAMKRAIFKHKPHMSIAETLFQLGQANRADNYWTEAEKNFREALAIRDNLESLPSKDSAATLVALLNALGEVAMHKGDVSEANHCYRRALRLAGSTNELLYPTLTYLIALTQAQGDVTNCIVYSKSLIELLKIYVPPGSNTITTAMYELGRLYIQVQDGPKAITLLMETKTLLDQKFIADPDVHTYYALAHLHYRLGEAFSLIGDGTNTLDAYKIALDMYTTHHARSNVTHHLDMAMTYLAIGIMFLKSGEDYKNQAVENVQKAYLEYCHINVGFTCQPDINAIIGLLGKMGAEVPNFVPQSRTDFEKLVTGNSPTENEKKEENEFTICNCFIMFVCCPCICLTAMCSVCCGKEAEPSPEALEMTSASEGTQSPLAIQR